MVVRGSEENFIFSPRSLIHKNGFSWSKALPRSDPCALGLVFQVCPYACKRVAPRQSDYAVVALLNVAPQWNGKFILSLILDLALENSF